MPSFSQKPLAPMASAVAILLLVITRATAMEPCPSFCRYRLCARLVRDGNQLLQQNRPLSMSEPDVALGPFACIPRRNFNQALRNVTAGEARVAKEFSGDRFVPISKYMKSEVTPNFSPEQFRWVPNIDVARRTDKRLRGRRTVARLRSRGNQEAALDRLCVQMPITSFVRFNPDGSPRGRIFTKGKSACVGFRTRVPKLQVDFQWDNTNDFDLRLEEPNGFEINRFGESTHSPNGGILISDNGGEVCQIALGNERIRYLLKDTVESGKYTIRVDFLRDCEPSSRYNLRVYYDGSVILGERGVLRKTGEGVIVRKFTIS